MILLSRYTWMCPCVGTMCVVVGSTMCAPCSATTSFRDVPWTTSPFFGVTIEMVAGLLGRTDDVTEGDEVGLVPPPPPPQATAVTASAQTAIASRFLVRFMASTSDGLGVVRGDCRPAALRRRDDLERPPTRRELHVRGEVARIEPDQLHRVHLAGRRDHRCRGRRDRVL